MEFQFIFNLMACGKGNNNKPIEDFITHSPAPVDMAAKMSAIYTELSFKVRKEEMQLVIPLMKSFKVTNAC